jgi:putative membrane protein
MHIFNENYFGMHFFWLIIWIAIIAAGVIFLKSILHNRPQRETPLQILRKRLAKGEISEDEFHRFKETLKN